MKVIDKHMDVFPAELPSGIPEHIVTHEIEFKPDAKPIKQRSYPLAPKYLPFVKQTVDMLMNKGFITRSSSPSSVPLTIAPKDGGTDYRFCVDYRAVNTQTISDATPPPNIQMLFDQLQGATVFSKIDLRTAYWQVQVKPSDRWKTAFTCRYGHFEWTVMPFGLKNAPATFGHFISADGIQVNPEKVKAITDWPTPKTVKDVRSFLGISGYYRRFINNYSKVAAQLTVAKQAISFVTARATNHSRTNSVQMLLCKRSNQQKTTAF